jgi:hypothetical protein
MDAAVLALGGEIDARARDDLRSETQGLKGRIRRGEVPQAFTEDWEVLRSEVDRALQGRPFEPWSNFGATIGRYHLAARASQPGGPLPDLAAILGQAQRVFEEVGPGVVPALEALVQHAPRLAVTGPGRLLHSVLGLEKYADDYNDYPDGGAERLCPASPTSWPWSWNGSSPTSLGPTPPCRRSSPHSVRNVCFAR